MAITFPSCVRFADLRLELARDGRLLFLAPVLAELIRYNGGDADAALLDEDRSMYWIAQLYLAHRQAGGEPDPVAEEILAEVSALQASDIPALQPGSERVH